MSDIDISATGLLKLLGDLKTKSAAGPGNMIVHMVMGEAREAILALRAALDAAEADKARAVEAERDRCIAAACGALDKRKALYTARHERALTMGSEDAALYEHLAASQDWAATAVVDAIRARGAKP